MTGCIGRTCAAFARPSKRAVRPTFASWTASSSALRRLPHRAIVDGDAKSAAIAAASIVAKVTRDRYMQTADALYPAYGFSSHVGYITPAHSAIVRRVGPCEIHRRSFQARCYQSEHAA